MSVNNPLFFHKNILQNKNVQNSEVSQTIQNFSRKTKKKAIKPFRKIKFISQRIRYGISEEDIWNADTYLAKTYARILEWYITKSNSVPYTQEYIQGLDPNNPDIVVMEQKRNAEYHKHFLVFQEYGKNGLAIDDEWQKELGGVLYEDLQESLKWFAQHYTELWD